MNTSKSDGILLPEDLLKEESSIIVASVLVSRATKPRLVVDQNEMRAIIEARHDSLLSGHPCRSRTFRNIARHIVWSGMRKMLYVYVDACLICQQSKSRRQKQIGLL